MKWSIHKFELDYNKLTQTLTIPGFLELLSVGNQNDTLMVWVKVGNGVPTQKITFIVRGTGTQLNDLPQNEKFIDTVQVGQYVWHVFQAEARYI
jgi:hypothetical protein